MVADNMVTQEARVSSGILKEFRYKMKYTRMFERDNIRMWLK